MDEQWKPSALRAAGDIDRQAADDIEFGVTISTRDGRQLVREWHAAIARSERAEAALRQWYMEMDDIWLAPGQTPYRINKQLWALHARMAAYLVINKPSDNDLLSPDQEEL